MFNDLRILVSGNYNAFGQEGFTGMGVYAASGLIQGTIEVPIYVGSSVELERRIPRGHIYDLKQNQHINYPLQNYYNKYGEENIVYFLLESCERTQEACLKSEQKYIDFYGVASDNKSFNILKEAGSLRGAKQSVWTEERRKEMSVKMTKIAYWRGKTHSDNAKRKIGNASRGRIHSKEIRAKMSKSLLGHKLSEETKRKIGKSNSGKTCTDEVKKRIALKNAKSFSVLDTTSGFVHDCFNICEFCRNKNLNRKALLRTRNSKYPKQHGGWVLMDKGF